MLMTLLQSPIVTQPGFGAIPIEVNTFLFLGVKGLFIIGALLYLAFAFVVTRQIHVMRSTVVTPFSPVVQILGFVHLIMALLVLLIFIVIL